MNFAKINNLKVIEDFAMGFGSYKGRNYGSIGDMAITSFNPQKMISVSLIISV